MDKLGDTASEVVEALHKKWLTLHQSESAKCRLQGVVLAAGAVVGFFVARRVWRSVVGYSPPRSHAGPIHELRHLGARRAEHMTHGGSCDCGHVRFTIRAPAHMDIVECYVRPCKGRFQHVILPAAALELQTSARSIMVTKHSTTSARFLNCADCGVPVMHFPPNSTEFVAINAQCFDAVTLEKCDTHVFVGTNWDNAFSTVHSRALVVEPGNPPTFDSRPRHGYQPDTSDVGTAAPAGASWGRAGRHVRRSSHPLTSTGVPYRSPYNATHDSLRAPVVLPPAQIEGDKQYLHSRLGLPPPVDYVNSAPLHAQRLDSVAKLARSPWKGVRRPSSQSHRDDSGSSDGAGAGAGAGPSAHHRMLNKSASSQLDASFARSTPGQSAVQSPTSARTAPYSRSAVSPFPASAAQATTPFTMSPHVREAKLNKRVARSLQGAEAWALAADNGAGSQPHSEDTVEPDANPGLVTSRSSNSSFSSVLSQGSAHSTASGRHDVGRYYHKESADTPRSNGSSMLRAASNSQPLHGRPPRTASGLAGQRLLMQAENMRQHLGQHVSPR